MSEAIRIVKEQNIHSYKDLREKLDQTENKIAELKIQNRKTVEQMNQYRAVANKLKDYKQNRSRDAKRWLKSHGIDYKHDNYKRYEDHANKLNAQHERIYKEMTLLNDFSQECEKAYNIIKDNLEPQTYLPRTSRKNEKSRTTKSVWRRNKKNKTSKISQINKAKQQAEEICLDYQARFKSYLDQTSIRAQELEQCLTNEKATIEVQQQEPQGFDVHEGDYAPKTPQSDQSRYSHEKAEEVRQAKSKPVHLPPSEKIAQGYARLEQHDTGSYQSYNSSKQRR